MNKPDVRIFMVYHKASPFLKKKPFVPIQVGNGKPIPGIHLRDNIGDNIASKNPNYCELTAQYWIWKNVKADYVGLAHYRRLPSFTGEYASSFPDFSEKTCKRFGWNEKTVRALLRDHDILMSPCWPVYPPGEPGHLMTPYEFHSYEHRESDIAETLKVIADVSPSMAKYAHKALCEDTSECFGNVCVMRKDLFDNYSAWLFKVLFELEKRITLPEDKEQARLFGYLSERLVMVWLLYAREKLRARVWFSVALPIGDFPEDIHPTQVAARPHPANENPLLSVIVPVYNVAPYLHKCLNSICTQALEDIEIICIDDGSQDGSSEIIGKYAQIDKRIRIVYGDHSGLGPARNRGLEIAKGKYIAFVDSDDWVDRYIWWRSVRKMEALDLELFFFEPIEVSDETGKKWFNNWSRLRFPEKCYGGAFTWRDIGRDPFDTCCYAHNRIVRRDFWGDRRFPNYFAEDAAIHYSLLFSAKRIGAFECPFYFYRQRPGSLMSATKGRERIVDGHINIIKDTHRDFSSYPDREQLKSYYCDYVLHLLCHAYNLWPTAECYRRLRKFVSDGEQAWMRSRTQFLGLFILVLRFAPRSMFERACRRFDVYERETNDRKREVSKLVRGFVKGLFPYGLMRVWLRSKYRISIPVCGHGLSRCAIDALPLGIVRRMKIAEIPDI